MKLTIKNNQTTKTPFFKLPLGQCFVFHARGNVEDALQEDVYIKLNNDRDNNVFNLKSRTFSYFSEIPQYYFPVELSGEISSVPL